MTNIKPKGKGKFSRKLKFRRQFLLGHTQYRPNKYWNVKKLAHNLFLSVHQDLSFFSKRKKDRTITLIGTAIDCIYPFKTHSQIVTDLLHNFNSIDSVINKSKPLAGRWIVICQNAHNTLIFTDPCGLRQVYFFTGKNSCCASQPTLINQVEKLIETTNEEILKLINSATYKNTESAWIGNKTVYENCQHLMPNHYLDLNKCSQLRFFPKKPLSILKSSDMLTSRAASYLKNIMTGLNHRYDLQVGLTAGFDSRLLLAASVDIYDEISYLTDDLGQLKNYHDDIYVPKKLAQKLKLAHSIKAHNNEQIPNWFYDLLSQNVSEARINPVLPKIKTIYRILAANNSEHISLNGNVIETVRIMEKNLKYEASHHSMSRIDFILGFTGYNNQYVRDEVNLFINSFDISLITGATLLDIFYWEQRMGNWGALYPAELDIAAETISPFNCRLLLETCLKAERKLRLPPDYVFFKEIIWKLWPEVLSEPINPGPRGMGKFKKVLRENLPTSAIKLLRKMTP